MWEGGDALARMINPTIREGLGRVLAAVALEAEGSDDREGGGVSLGDESKNRYKAGTGPSRQ